MIYGNGKTNWEIWQCNNSLAETHFTHSHYFHSALKRFKMALMCSLWLQANQDISRHQCNSKRIANNRCYLTQQEQTSRSLPRCIIFMASKRCLNAAKVRHSTELPNINQWTRTTLYTKPCVSDTSGVYSMVVRRLRPRYVCFAEGLVLMQTPGVYLKRWSLVLMLFRIFISQIEYIKYVFDWAWVKRRK